MKILGCLLLAMGHKNSCGCLQCPGSVQAPSASRSDPRSRPRANAFAPEPPASGDPVPHVIMPETEVSGATISP